MEAIFNYMTGLSHNWVTVAANGIWIGALLTALAWLMRRSAKTVNAATGYLVWWAVLALVIVSPLLLGGPTADTPKQAIERDAPEVLAAELESATLLPADEPNHMAVAIAETPPAGETETILATAASERFDAQDRSVGAATHVESDTGPSVMSILARLLPVSLFALWACIASVLVFRIWLAYRRMVAIKRRSVPFNALRFPRVDGLLRRAALKRRTALHLTDEIGSPVAAGLGHPVILIPRKMAGQLTEHELEAVVVHELAHMLRWDDWTKLAQKTIEAFMFFNPAVRWIGRQLELEREVACDDRVVAQTGEPTEYARCLTRLTELAIIPSASLIPGVLTGRKQIFQRFDQLLSGKRRTEIQFCRSRFACAVVAILLVTVVAVRVVPVVALPADAVSYEEFSETVETITANIMSEPVLGETDEDESPAWTGSGLEELTTEPARFTSGLDEPIDAIFAAETEFSTDEPAVFFASTEATAEDTKVSDESTHSNDRVVDWNDDIFDLPITGTIHGSGRDDAIEVWINEAQTLRAAIKGKVRFTKDRREVRSVSRDGYLAIKEEHGSVLKELDVRRGNDGLVEYSYFVDGKPQEYDKDARKLLATVIDEMSPLATTALVPVPDVPGVYSTGQGLAVLPVPDNVPPALVIAPSARAERAALAERVDADAPEPRIGREGFIGRVIDWASNPFNMNGTGLMISSDDEGETSILWSDGRNKIKVKMDGKVEFTDDDQAIKSISRRGYFAIWERNGSKTRELTVEPDRSGNLDYGYYVNDKNRPFDEDAQDWLADILLDVIRKTGIGAKTRAERILGQDGVDGVLEEIQVIESNYVKRIYFNAILDNADLSNSEYARILDLVGGEIDSDYEKAEILTGMADRVSENSALIHDYVGVVATIDSDYETRKALSAVSLGKHVDPEVIDAVLEIAGDMDSDYEKAELLIAMSPYCKARGGLQTSYVNAMIDIDSDYEARRVLTALSLEGDVDPDITYAVMEVIGGFDSDYEAAELLIDMAPFIADHQEAQSAYLTAVENIDSDYEIKRTLTSFIDVGEMTDTRVLAILPIVESMSSSYEQSEILKDLAQYCRGNDELEEAYIDVVETLDSDYEIEKLYTHLYRRDRGSRRSGR